MCFKVWFAFYYGRTVFISLSLIRTRLSYAFFRPVSYVCRVMAHMTAHRSPFSPPTLYLSASHCSKVEAFAKNWERRNWYVMEESIGSVWDLYCICPWWARGILLIRTIGVRSLFGATLFKQCSHMSPFLCLRTLQTKWNFRTILGQKYEGSSYYVLSAIFYTFMCLLKNIPKFFWKSYIKINCY
jgi:hypothetical protein